MILEEKYKLSNGVEIPKLGLGTWLISDKDVVQAVKDAVKIGYRHIDTAQAYEERGAGDGIRAGGVRREDLFVTTKLAAEAKSYKEAAAGIDKSLETLGLDYIDMMIIHSPQPWTEFGKYDRYLKETVKHGEPLKKHIKPENFVQLVFRTSKKLTSITFSNPAP